MTSSTEARSLPAPMPLASCLRIGNLLRRWAFGGLICAACVMLPSSAEALSVEARTILVTHRDGHTTTLSVFSPDTGSMFLQRSAPNTSFLWGIADECFPILLAGPIENYAAVNCSQIQRISLQPGAAVSIELDSGAVMRGTLADKGLSIRGKTQAGRVSYKIADLASLQFVEFSIRERDATEAVGREEAARAWTTCRGEHPVWTIQDGGKRTSAQGVEISDYYRTNRSRNAVWYGKTFPDETIHTQFTGSIDKASIVVKLADVQRIEITGRKLGDAAEAIVTSRDGTSKKMGLTLCKSQTYYFDQNHQVRLEGAASGPFDKADRLRLATRLGYEFIPLLPLRQLTIEAPADVE